MIETELLIQKEVIQALDAPLLTEVSFNYFIHKLEGHINDLIQNDFQKLVAVLYKIDIDEGHLKKVLKNSKEKNSAAVITKLIINRHQKKLIPGNNLVTHRFQQKKSGDI